VEPGGHPDGRGFSGARIMVEPDRDSVLTVTELTKIYGGRKPTTAVDRLSFALGRGEILGLLGPNGAGKTTTIQMLLSTLKPTAGRIDYFGQSLETARETILARVGFASAYSKLPLHLTIDENLDVFGRLYGLSAADRKARSQELLTRFGVWDLRRRIMTGLSAGQTTRVMLAKAFLARPWIVLLDEPTASLDPDIAHEVRDFVCEQRDHEGVSILYTSHNMDEVAQICDRVLFLDKGRIAAEGRPDELAASVAAARIRLRVERGLDDLLGQASARGLAAWVDDGAVEVEIDERHVAEFLAALARLDVRYSELAIDKPTLEDYFLKLARRKGSEVNTEGLRNPVAAADDDRDRGMSP
jgi:ABC-2 type transport system ATP-binding protein